MWLQKSACVNFFCCLILIQLYMLSNGHDRVARKALFFRAYTIMQINSCVVAPLESPPGTLGRLGFNVCVQVNYNLPSLPSSFYKPAYWSAKNLLSSSTYQWLNNIFNPNKIEPESNEDESKSNSTHVRKRDLSAGEFYYSLEEMLEEHGYHRDCLLKSVCELAKIPLAMFNKNEKERNDDDDDDNLLHDIVHYILSPSVHLSFDSNEIHQRKIFEAAEKIGKQNGDCHRIFSDCIKSPLEHATNTIEYFDSFS